VPFPLEDIVATDNLAPPHRPRKRRGAGEKRRSPETLTGSVYVASSLPTFATDRYGRMVEHAAAHFPKATILPARDAFRSDADWRQRWPAVQRSLAAVVFFDDGAGFIGLGTLSEITDAARRRLPVYYLTPSGVLLPCDDSGAVELAVRPWNPTRAALVTYALSGPDALAGLRASAGRLRERTNDDERDDALFAAWVARSGRGVGDG